MTLGRIATFLIIIGVLGYVGVHMVGLLAPPMLVLSSPPQGLTTSNSAIAIKGKTLPGATVEINNSPLPALEGGEFNHILVLHDGLNTITVSAKKRYSKPTIIERQIFILEGGKISQNITGGI